MINVDDYDLSELRTKWARRRVGVEQVKARADVRGMTRPARDPDEAAFLRETGQEGPVRGGGPARVARVDRVPQHATRGT